MAHALELQRILGRPAPSELTPEQAHEARRAKSSVSDGADADRVAVGETGARREGRAARVVKKRR